MSKELIARLRHESPGPNHIATEAADLIEQQQSWIASLEQNARDADRMYKELETELAASQAQIKVLRYCLEVVCKPVMESHAAGTSRLEFFNDTLGIKSDDSALHEMLAKERGRCIIELHRNADKPIDEIVSAIKAMEDK